jgi:glutaredoxin 3
MLILVALTSGTMLLWPLLQGGGARPDAGRGGAADQPREGGGDRRVRPTSTPPATWAARKNIPLHELEARLPTVVKNKATCRWCWCAPRACARAGRWPSPANWATRTRSRWPAALKAWREANLPVEKSLSPLATQGNAAMQAVKMYTTAVCPYCIRAKQLLKAQGREQIEEIRIDTGPGPAPVMMEITGRRTVPQIFIGDTHVGGCDDLMALDARGGLMPCWRADRAAGAPPPQPEIMTGCPAAGAPPGAVLPRRFELQPLSHPARNPMADQDNTPCSRSSAST